MYVDDFLTISNDQQEKSTLHAQLKGEIQTVDLGSVKFCRELNILRNATSGKIVLQSIKKNRCIETFETVWHVAL